MDNKERLRNMSSHPYVKLMHKDELYDTPTQYTFKGTPSVTSNSGDFKVLKKAHQAMYKPPPKCKMCNVNTATVYSRLILKHVDRSIIPKINESKEYNACEDCVLFFFQEYLKS